MAADAPMARTGVASLHPAVERTKTAHTAKRKTKKGKKKKKKKEGTPTTTKDYGLIRSLTAISGIKEEGG